MKTLLFAAATALCASVSHAAVIDLTGSGGASAHYDFGHLTVTGRAGGLLNGGLASLGSRSDVFQSALGLGVVGAPDRQPDQIDGAPVGSYEALILSFDRSVTLNSLTFTGFDSDDEVTLFADSLFDSMLYFPGDLDGDTLRVGRDGMTFGLAAIGTPIFDGVLSGNDQYALAAVDVDVAPVPLPAGALLLLSGLAAAAGLGTRRRAA